MIRISATRRRARYDQQGRSHERQDQLHEDGRPEVFGDLLGGVPADGVGDISDRGSPQPKIEEAEVAEDDQDQGQDAESLRAEAADDQGQKSEADQQRDAIAEKIEDGILGQLSGPVGQAAALGFFRLFQTVLQVASASCHRRTRIGPAAAGRTGARFGSSP